MDVDEEAATAASAVVAAAGAGACCRPHANDDYDEDVYFDDVMYLMCRLRTVDDTM